MRPRRNWVPFGKFTLPVVQDKGKFDRARLRMRCRRGFSTVWCGCS